MSKTGSFVRFGGLQRGKSQASAIMAAAMIKAGKKVALAYVDKETGEARCDPIVTVPGYEDGTQIEDHNCHRRNCDANPVATKPNEGA